MAIRKRKPRLTAAEIKAAQPTVELAIAAKCKALGHPKAAGIFRRHKTAGKLTTKRYYQKFVDGGGTVGDFKSFFEWLMEHSDEIISFISKIIKLFAVVCLLVCLSPLLLLGVVA